MYLGIVHNSLKNCSRRENRHEECFCERKECQVIVYNWQKLLAKRNNDAKNASAKEKPITSLEIVSLRYGWTGRTDKNRKWFGKTESKTESVLAKHKTNYHPDRDSQIRTEFLVGGMTLSPGFTLNHKTRVFSCLGVGSYHWPLWMIIEKKGEE